VLLKRCCNYSERQKQTDTTMFLKTQRHWARTSYDNIETEICLIDEMETTVQMAMELLETRYMFCQVSCISSKVYREYEYSWYGGNQYLHLYEYSAYEYLLTHEYSQVYEYSILASI
jgi:hypothetical protein